MSRHSDQPPSYMEATSGMWGSGGGTSGSGGAGGFSYGGGPSAPPQDELSMWFCAVDEDGNGHITADELRQALLDENCKPFSQSTCRMLVRMFDDNANGEIELSEFVQLFHYVRKWREVFLQHDADFSGTIEVDELLEAVNTVHNPLRFSRQFCDQLMRRFGHRIRSGEHCLSLDNFISLNARLSRLVSEHSGRPDGIESFLLSRIRDS